MRADLREETNVISWTADGVNRVALIALDERSKVHPLSINFYTYAVGEAAESVELAIKAMLDGLMERVAVFAPTIVGIGDAKVLRGDVSEEEKAWIFERAKGDIDIMRNMVVGRGGLSLAKVVTPGDEDEGDMNML